MRDINPMSGPIVVDMEPIETTIERWLNKIEQMQPVYDAAMARHKAKVRYNGLGLEEAGRAQSWADYMNAEQELDRVCRRAKEGA